MSFKSDLADIIKQQFNNVGIRYEDNVDVCGLAARYLEMLNRRIVPTARRGIFPFCGAKTYRQSNRYCNTFSRRLTH